jgi:hypothetical protein
MAQKDKVRYLRQLIPQDRHIFALVHPCTLPLGCHGIQRCKQPSGPSRIVQNHNKYTCWYIRIGREPRVPENRGSRISAPRAIV